VYFTLWHSGCLRPITRSELPSKLQFFLWRGHKESSCTDNLALGGLSGSGEGGKADSSEKQPQGKDQFCNPASCIPDDENRPPLHSKTNLQLGIDH